VRFFEDLPDRDVPDDDRVESPMPEWFGPPRDVLGGVVPLNEVVVRGEHVFIGLQSVIAFPTGLLIALWLGGRRLSLPKDRWAAVHDSFFPDIRRRRRPPDEKALRLGIEFPDGRRLGALGRLGYNPFRDDPEPPVLIEQGGGAQGGPQGAVARTRLWLWPLPQDDELSLVLEWPELDVPLTYHRIDLEPARVAVATALPFWP